MSEIFGMDFGGTDLPDDYNCPDVAEGDDSTVDPVEINESEASTSKIKIDPVGGTKGDAPLPSFGCNCGCSDCSGSCWLTCGGTCKHSWSGTMN